MIDELMKSLICHNFMKITSIFNGIRLNTKYLRG